MRVLVLAALLAGAAMFGSGKASAQDATAYRCQLPGSPAIYRSGLTPDEAKSLGCRAIDSAPIIVTKPEGPRNLQECVRPYESALQREREVGKVSGYVDKQLMHAAGVQIVECRRRFPPAPTKAASGR